MEFGLVMHEPPAVGGVIQYRGESALVKKVLEVPGPTVVVGDNVVGPVNSEERHKPRVEFSFRAFFPNT